MTIAGPIDTLFSTDKAYWNIAASLWGFYYGELARLGTSAIAASQLTGYPPATWKGIVMPDGASLLYSSDACANKSRELKLSCAGKPVNNNFPCVSMMDWRGNGSDTARTWALQMTIDIMGNEPKRVVPTTVSGGATGWPLPSTVYSIGFELASGQQVVLISNTNASAASVSVAGAAGATSHTVDASAGYAEVPYKTATLGGEKLELAPSAFVLLELKKR